MPPTFPASPPPSGHGDNFCIQRRPACSRPLIAPSGRAGRAERIPHRHVVPTP
jgi:hypothetical protein